MITTTTTEERRKNRKEEADDDEEERGGGEEERRDEVNTGIEGAKKSKATDGGTRKLRQLANRMRKCGRRRQPSTGLFFVGRPPISSRSRYAICMSASPSESEISQCP